MIAVITGDVRFYVTTLRAELVALKSSTRLNRPVSPATVKHVCEEALESLDALELAILGQHDDQEEDDGPDWDLDDLVVLAGEEVGS